MKLEVFNVLLMVFFAGGNERGSETRATKGREGFVKFETKCLLQL